jgi:hypothetical protein
LPGIGFYSICTKQSELIYMKNRLYAERRTVIWACITVSLFVLTFILLWWNRYLAVTNDGWHFFHAQQLLNGKTPYKDFYLFIPPLHSLRLAGEIALFGNYLIVPQIFGLLERLILFVVLTVWLCRYFAPKYVTIGIITGSVAYLADTSETLSSLHHEAVFWPTLATFCLCSALNSAKHRLLWCFASGILAGLAFSGKQTSGIGITVAIPVFLFMAFNKEGWRAVAKVLVVFASGFLIPVGMIAIWLVSQGAFFSYIDQIFLRGPSSKGSLAKLLIRPIAMTLEDVYMRRNAVMALLFVATVAFLIYRSRKSEAKTDSGSKLVIVLTGAFLTLFAGVALSFYMAPPFSSYFINAASQIPMYVAEIGMLALFIHYGWLWIKGSLDSEQWQLWAFSFTTLAVIVTLSFSWAIFVSMLIPALPFLIAFALSRLDKKMPLRFMQTAIVIACMGIVVVTAWCKLSRPYNWAGWNEPAFHYATESSSLPELNGIRLSPVTKERVERITQLIRENSSPEESVFIHPHIPMFYVLAHRRPNTFAAIHFFDVSPDYIAQQDAQTILANPPSVIVDFEFNEEQLKDNENLFRSGQRSGQRDLIEAIHNITADYVLLETFELSPNKNLLKVWAKRNK